MHQPVYYHYYSTLSPLDTTTIYKRATFQLIPRNQVEDLSVIDDAAIPFDLVFQNDCSQPFNQSYTYLDNFVNEQGSIMLQTPPILSLHHYQQSLYQSFCVFFIIQSYVHLSWQL